MIVPEPIFHLETCLNCSFGVGVVEQFLVDHKGQEGLGFRRCGGDPFGRF